ncbi:MAG: hypothetical protein ABUJ92_00055 [Desulfobacterales bacterium]
MTFEEWAAEQGLSLHTPLNRGLGSDYSQADTRIARDAWEGGQQEQREKDAGFVDELAEKEIGSALKELLRILAVNIREG